jgi:hypothetical protein
MLTQKDQLKDKVEVKQKKLQARLAELKAESRESVMKEREEIEHKLAELRATLSDGWNNLSESAAKKINDWLDKN